MTRGNPRRALPALLAGAALLLAATPAQASFEGTPGRVAYVSGEEPYPLKLWDPAAAAVDPQNPDAGVTTIEASTFRLGDEDSLSLGLTSAPSWSPDGTRFVYSKTIDGTGNSPKTVFHTALFVYDLRTGTSTQLTHPADTLVDETGEPALGHTVADFGPAWSSDGTRIAFIRQVSANLDDELEPHIGQNLWTVGAGGSGETRRTSFGPDSGRALLGSLVWIPGTQELVASLADNSGLKLVRIGIGGGYSDLVDGMMGILDFDVSPDGNRLTYSAVSGGLPTLFEGSVTTGAAVQVDTPPTGFARFHNGGEALLYRGTSADQPGVSGLLQRVVDPDLYDRGPANDRVVLPWGGKGELVAGGGGPSRAAFDIQPQTLPIIFVPGFLGSTIACGGDELWPDMPFPDLNGMNLTSDGNGNLTCPAAGPTGTIVETVLGSDVYESTADWLRGAFDASRLTLFGWDWRKAPHRTFERLDDAITDALDRPGPWKEQRAGRVVLYGHSYGGLLIRSFIEGASGARVARVLTAGSPYWGSPKAVFPLAFGVESPGWSVMDLLISNVRMRSLAGNLAGLYHLYPSDRFGPWMSINGAVQSQSGVLSFVDAIGGNAGLLGQAFASHRDVIDGFYNREGFIDVRAIAGSGLPTVSSFHLAGDLAGDVLVEGSYGNGDSTVPLRSADQLGDGPRPLGDPVALQYTCNVAHVPLPGSPAVRHAYEDFLDFGRPARRLGPRCVARGGIYSYSSHSIGRIETRSSRGAFGRVGSRYAAAAGPMSFDEAQTAGLADVIDAEPRTLVVVDDDLPVTLTTPIANGTFSYTPLTDSTAGTTLEYGPLTGALELSPGAPGGAPTVTLDGQPVPGRPVGPSPTPTPTPDPTPGSGSPPPPAGSRHATAPPSTTERSAPFSFVGTPALKRRRLRLRVHLPRAGTLRASVTRGKRRLGRLRVRVKAAGDRTFTIKLKSRPRGSLKLTVSFGGKVLRAKLRPRA